MVIAKPWSRKLRLYGMAFTGHPDWDFYILSRSECMNSQHWPYPNLEIPNWTQQCLVRVADFWTSFPTSHLAEEISSRMNRVESEVALLFPQWVSPEHMSTPPCFVHITYYLCGLAFPQILTLENHPSELSMSQLYDFLNNLQECKKFTPK